MGNGQNPSVATNCGDACTAAGGGGNGYPSTLLCSVTDPDTACKGWVATHPCTTRWSSVCSNPHPEGNNDITVQRGCPQHCAAAQSYGVTEVPGSGSSRSSSS